MKAVCKELFREWVGPASGLLLVAVCCLCASATRAAVINVNDAQDLVSPGDGLCTLREAISNANLGAGGDLTAGDCAAGSAGADAVIVPADNYVLTLNLPGEDLNAGGDLDVLDDLTLIGAGAGATILDADGIDRVLDVGPGGQSIEVEISALGLTGGAVGSTGAGGGLRIGGSAVVQGLELELIDNLAERGGGIYNDGTLYLGGAAFYSNRAEFGGDGGAIYNARDAEIASIVMSSNQADRNGGCVYNSGDLQFQDSSCSFCVSGQHGGAIFNVGLTFLTSTDFGVNESGADGGAIHHSGSTMLVQSCRFLNNGAIGNGAGIYSTADMQVHESEIQGGVAFMNGGGIVHTAGTLEISDSEVSMNQCSENGGGIHNTGDLLAARLRLMINSAGLAGSGLFNGGTASLGASLVYSNYGPGEGGGAFNSGDLSTDGVLIGANQARHGGGIYTDGSSTLNLFNSTVSGNWSVEEGAGLFVEGSAAIDFTTVATNQSTGTAAGGLFNAGHVEIKNSIIAENPGDCVQLGSLDSFGYNLDEDGSCGFGAGPADISGVAPNLGPLQPNGGPTMTHALLLPSVAIDSADPDCLSLASTIVTVDQRGMPRPIDGDGNSVAICDRGAHETALPSGPQPPVPNGIFGSPLRVGRANPTTADLDLFWDTAPCPADGYHLLYGEIDTVASYGLDGSQCGLSTSGVDVWLNSPTKDLWFIVVGDDVAQTEGSWGSASSGVRNGSAASNECSMIARDNSGTCP